MSAGVSDAIDRLQEELDELQAYHVRRRGLDDTSRRKGHDFERECATALTRATGLPHHRTLIETRDGNQGDLCSPFPLAIQCKVGKNPPIYPAIDQAVAAAREGQVPVALIRRNATAGRPKADSVVMRQADWCEWLRLMVSTGAMCPVRDQESSGGTPQFIGRGG